MHEDTCPYCRAKLNKYWHRITPIYVDALLKFQKAIRAKGENNIHLLKDMKGTENELTPHEWNNWTKLRFHGLVSKAEQSGYWSMTQTGERFLQGEIAIPLRVQTFRNEVVGYDEEHVTIHDVVSSFPYVERNEDIERELYVGEAQSLIHYDERGQGAFL